MIEFFRRSSPFNILFLVLYAVVLHAYLYIKPFDPTHIHIASPLGYYLFKWLWSLPLNINWLIASLTIAMSLANAILLNYTATQFKLMPQFSFLSGYIYITMTACIPTLDLFSPEIITCFFFLIALHRILGIYKSKHSTGTFFDIGLMLSIGLLFVPAYWTMIIFIYFSFIVLRPFSIIEWGAAALGLVLPILLCGTVFFVIDKLPLFVNLIQPDFQQWNHYSFIRLPVKQLLAPAFVLGTAVTAGFSLQRFLPKMVVQLRTFFNMFFRLLFFVLLMNGIHRSNGLQHYMVLVVPLSIPVSYVLARRKNLMWIDIWWLFIVILILVMPFIR